MDFTLFATAVAKKESSMFLKSIKSKAWVLVGLLIFFLNTTQGQNLITVPFNNGFVGTNTGNNSASNCYYFSGVGGLGWTNVQFAQNSPTNIFVAQGNDIIGSVLITDANGVEWEIPGFIKWRTPSGGSPSTMVFAPNVGSSFTLATNGFNGASTYTITNGNYIGLTFNGQTLTINPVPGTVTGNAATNGLLDTLNNYLASFADMSVADISVNENAGTVTITVTISTPVSSVVTVNYATSNGTAIAGLDYTAVSGSLTFPANVISLTFTVPILNDALAEGNETFTVTLTDPVNISLLDPIAVVTITDDDNGVEVCNGIDDNGNGQIDEGVLNTYYADVDGDGYGNPGSSIQACSPPSGYVTNNTDCNDTNAGINPTTVWYLDADGDGYY
ncbi:MAG: Calx-beta domain-containing protein, partial [Bacteroidota bacterium]